MTCTMRLYEKDPDVKSRVMVSTASRVRDLAVVDRFEQRSSLYGLLVRRKDKVGWEAVPVAQSHKRVVKRPAA